MSAPSLAPYILKRPWLSKMLKPVANWYVNAAGYRKLGLRYGRPHEMIRCGIWLDLADHYGRVWSIWNLANDLLFAEPMI